MIRFNHIVGNAVVSGEGYRQCGWRRHPLRLRRADHREQRDPGNGGRYGGGIVLFLTAATVRNNLILENQGGEDFGGAGLWIVDQLSSRLGNVVEYNTIVRNRSLPGGTTQPRALNGIAGGLWTSGVELAFRNNIIWGNGRPGETSSTSPPTRVWCWAATSSRVASTAHRPRREERPFERIPGSRTLPHCGSAPDRRRDMVTISWGPTEVPGRRHSSTDPQAPPLVRT